MNLKFLKISFAVFAVLIGGQVFGQQPTPNNMMKFRQPIRHASAIIGQLEPISYEFNRPGHFNLPATTQYGFESGSVKQVIPWAVCMQTTWLEDGKNSSRAFSFESVDLQKLVPFLVSAIQEQQVELTRINKELKKLKGEKTKSSSGEHIGR
jgi:hypothetical protein